jgi:TolA-binding protein
MNRTVKLVLYGVLLSVACFFGYGFYQHYNHFMKPTYEKDEEDRVGSAATPGAVRAPQSAKFSTIVMFGGAFFVSVVGLGLLLGHDFSHLVAQRFGRLLFHDEGETIKDTDYEKAEEIWANGNHLEAIQLMRDYLQKNPKEQHVALRIAEIYEKDLGNFLAAALEYEELLKQKLQSEQWGWAAIHLCNLYTKLGKTDKTVALLKRVVEEYGETSAAEKARKRLEMHEEVEEIPEETPEATPQAAKPSPLRVVRMPAAQPLNADLQKHFEKFHKTKPSENRSEES